MNLASSSLLVLTPGDDVAVARGDIAKGQELFADGLGVTALGIGLGAAFSPTDERPAALLAAMTGILGYALCAVALIRLG